MVFPLFHHSVYIQLGNSQQRPSQDRSTSIFPNDTEICIPFFMPFFSTSMKYFETEVVHCVFDDLSIAEAYSWRMCSSNSRLSCMLHYKCLLRAVGCGVCSGINSLFLLMTLCASLSFKLNHGLCRSLHAGLETGRWLEAGRLLCPGHGRSGSASRRLRLTEPGTEASSCLFWPAQLTPLRKGPSRAACYAAGRGSQKPGRAGAGEPPAAGQSWPVGDVRMHPVGFCVSLLHLLYPHSPAGQGGRSRHLCALNISIGPFWLKVLVLTILWALRVTPLVAHAMCGGVFGNQPPHPSSWPPGATLSKEGVEAARGPAGSGSRARGPLKSRRMLPPPWRLLWELPIGT